MTRIFVVAFCFGVFFGYSWKAFAAESGASTSHLLGFVGTAGAVNLGNSADPSLKSSGNFSEAMVLGTFETRKFVFDLGFGTFSSRISGTSSAAPGMNTLTLNSYQMDKAGEVAHLGARYRLTDAIEAGLFTQMLFGTDVGFASSYLRTDHTTAWLGGVDALYGFSWLGLRWKAGGRAFQSFGLDERKLTAFQGLIQTSLKIL